MSATRTSSCPICQRSLSSDAHRPFCSQRCQVADLDRWLGGSYRIAGPPVDPRDVELLTGKNECER